MTKAWRIAVAVTVAVVAAGVIWAIAQPNGVIDEATVIAYADEGEDGLRQVIKQNLADFNDGTLNVAVAWLSDDEIEQELIEAQARGVTVRVLVRDDEDNADDCRSGYGEHVESVHHMTQIHDKFAVIGNRVMTGSVNWTSKSIGQPNNIVIIESERIADYYRDRFGELLGDSKTDAGCPD